MRRLPSECCLLVSWHRYFIRHLPQHYLIPVIFNKTNTSTPVTSSFWAPVRAGNNYVKLSDYVNICPQVQLAASATLGWSKTNNNFLLWIFNLGWERGSECLLLIFRELLPILLVRKRTWGGGNKQARLNTPHTTSLKIPANSLKPVWVSIKTTLSQNLNNA